MSSEPDFTVPDAVREEDDDHDMLTYNESGARLAEEIKTVQKQLAESVGETKRALEERLGLLTEAATRNTRWAAVDTKASSFLAYRGPGTSLDQ